MSAALSITASGIGKRHGRTWIWRNVELEVQAGETLALLGANGSGKSSLLRVLCGFDAASEGHIDWHIGPDASSREALPGHIGYCAPDQDLILELTVREQVDFHRSCRVSDPALDTMRVIDLALLEGKENRRVGELSSGMRQRLALTLAFTTPSSGLFLDEPTSHLDKAGRDWYHRLTEEHRHDRTLIVASNHNDAEVPSGARNLTLGLPG